MLLLMILLLMLFFFFVVVDVVAEDVLKAFDFKDFKAFVEKVLPICCF